MINIKYKTMLHFHFVRKFLITCRTCTFPQPTKGSFRSLSRIKNNFMFKNEFKKAFENGHKKINLTEKIVSSDIVLGHTNFVNNKGSSQQYKGELIFGIHPVYMALLKRKRELHHLFIRNETEASSKNNLRKIEIVNLATSLNIPIKSLDTKELKAIVPGVVHQGVCLDAGPLSLPGWSEKEAKDIIQDTLPLWIVLDEIIDPMNVGAIFRSAYYFGANKIFVVKGNSCKLSPIVSKASSGALEIMDIHQIENLEYFLQVMKSNNWNIISTLAYCQEETDTIKAIDASEYKLKGPTILILGNESRGVSASVKNLCNAFISIYPYQQLHKGIDSLNVSVATGVILYSLSKSWKKFCK